MILKNLNEIVESDIRELKEAGVQEGKTIEYKQELPGTRDEDKRERPGGPIRGCSLSVGHNLTFSDILRAISATLFR